MDEEDWRIICDELMCDPQNPSNPLLTPEAFKVPPLSSGCVDDETVVPNHQLAWDILQSEQEFEFLIQPGDCVDKETAASHLSPLEAQPEKDLLLCDDGFESPPLYGDWVDEQTTSSCALPQPDPQIALGLIQNSSASPLETKRCVVTDFGHHPPTTHPKYPGNFMAGPFHTRAGYVPSAVSPSSNQTELHPTQEGPFHDQAGPSHTQACPSYIQSDPSHIKASPSHTQVGLSHIQSGPSHTQAGPSHTQSGPSHTEAGPSQIQSGSSHIQAGPSHTQTTHSTAFKCSQCNKIFKRPFNLSRHIRLAHAKEPTFLECGHYGRHFRRKDDHNYHMESTRSKSEPEQPCSKCGMTFTTSRSRNHHIQFQCPSLREQPLLGIAEDESSLTVDVDEGPTSIRASPTQAGPSFLLSGPFNTQLETYPIQIGPCLTQAGPSHTHNKITSKTNECERCKKVFTRKHDLVRHLQTVHGINAILYECDSCEAEFTRRDSLLKHIKSKHSNSKPDHVCSKCGVRYIHKGSLTLHLKYECCVPPQFSCSQCSYKTWHESNMKQHMTRVHGSPQ